MERAEWNEWVDWEDAEIEENLESRFEDRFELSSCDVLVDFGGEMVIVPASPFDFFSCFFLFF